MGRKGLRSRNGSNVAAPSTIQAVGFDVSWYADKKLLVSDRQLVGQSQKKRLDRQQNKLFMVLSISSQLLLIAKINSCKQ